jgi:hypothetical protein
MSRTYYRDDTVEINSTAIQVDGRWFPLSTLTYVWHRRTGRLRRGGYMLLSRGTAVLVVVALLVTAGIGARNIDFGGRPMVVAGAILGGLVVLGIAAFAVEFLLEAVDRTHEQGRGHHEIWVQSGGREFMLYTTTDSVRFAQIYRALQRALESLE